MIICIPFASVKLHSILPKLLIILRYSYLLDDCNYFVVTCSAVDKVLNAYYVKLLAPPTIIHPLYSKKNKNGTVH